MNTKSLVQFANAVKAEDLTLASQEYIVNLIGRETGMTTIHTVSGRNGITGAVVRGNISGKFYFVAKRCSNLFVVI